MIINKEKWLVKRDFISDLGNTDFERLIITIKYNLPAIEERRTLLHEIVHAYIYSYGIPLPKDLTEEQLCDFIAYNHNNFTELLKEAEKELREKGE